MAAAREDLGHDHVGMHRQAWLNWRLFAWLCAAELLTLGAICALYRGAGKSDLSAFLLSRPGLLFLLLIAGVGLAIGGALFHVRRQSRLRQSRCGRTFALNLAMCVCIFGLGEIVVRTLTVDTLRGPALGGVELRPLVWKEVAEHFVKKAEEQRGKQFFPFDPVLGWTVRPNSTGESGLFQSSVQGIRSPHRGVDYASANPKCRIALVGDSFVFGEEAEFEKSWGHQLEIGLGNGCQVLNFGVPGYGVGQMHLRYKKDVSLFHPNVVIVGFTDGASYRALGVYGFLTFAPSYVPGPIPRYIFKDDQLKLINVPLIAPEAIYSTQTMEDLPYLRYARNYQPTEWEMPGWRLLSWSYLFRIYATFFPLWHDTRPEISERDFVAVNAALFHRLVDDIRTDGGAPLLVYFPDKNDYSAPRTGGPRSLEILRENGLSYFSLEGCVSQVALDRRFLKQGDHYSEEGESVVARCLTPIVNELLKEVSQ